MVPRRIATRADASEFVRDGTGLPSEAIARRASKHAVTAEKVERFLLENPFDVAFGTTRAIARRCQTSSATVVRAAQRLGCEGFVELLTLASNVC
jgi:DNA-binding MurR/RpiR family transcriptional regulator